MGYMNCHFCFFVVLLLNYQQSSNVENIHSGIYNLFLSDCNRFLDPNLYNFNSICVLCQQGNPSLIILFVKSSSAAKLILFSM